MKKIREKKRRKNTNKVMSQKPFLDNFVQRESKKKQYDFGQLTDKVLQKWLLGKA